ncbi:BlaI family transcriptional regulator [Brevifollis gellanilyticus]|uniref:BlaI family transcriptional regulator n=2 Tax=Brevifollis gellanilyticus TaxID=748831 RepID=A0A512MC04_9BACT|nr:BlaI family transcriptional regulator [Brevifollis gellanilyticus]
MDLVFARGEATLSQILEDMAEPPTRPALRSILTILEGKGQLKHRQDGREFIYQPVHSREEVGQSTLSRVIGTFFGGSVSQALASYLSHPKTQLTKTEVEELRRFLDQAKVKKP